MEGLISMRHSLLYRKLIILSLAAFGSQVAIAEDNTSAYVVGAMTAFTAGYSFFNDDTQGLKEFGEAAFIDLSVTYLLKYAVKEKRPDGSNDRSFPSANVSLAATNATYMGYRNGWKWGLGMGAVTALVGAERIHKDKSDLVDVLGGMAIGFLSAAIVTTNKNQLKLMPSYDPDNNGYLLNFNYTF